MSCKFTIKSSHLLFVALLWCCRYGALAQTDGGQESRQTPGFSLPGNSGKGGGIVSLGGVPVSLYTGAASPGMSLYTLPSRSLSVPVTLGYTAGNGVQVVSQASEVGTGWELSVGGEVSCEVRGNPDELDNTDKEWLGSLANRTTNVGGIRSKFCDGGDTEYDVYHASAMGMQVDFVVRGPYGNNVVQVYALNNRQVAITPTFATWGNTRRIVSFTITDGSGTRYVFDNSTQTRVHSQTERLSTGELWPASDKTYTSTWHLTRVTSLLGDNVYFSYDPYITYGSGTGAATVYKTFIQRYKAFVSCDAGGNNCTPFNGPRTGRDGSTQRADSDYETTVTISHPYTYRLATVYSTSGRLKFIRGRHKRRDAPGQYALSEVQVTDAEDRIIKRFQFDYGYFGSATTTNPDEVRLKLLSVREQSAGCAAATTRFSYQEIGSVARLTSPRDYWGYFTNPNSRFADPSNPRGTMLPKRTPDASYMQNCLLQSISSSTGAVTTLEYEAHRDRRGVIIGGVRLKKVTVHDGMSTASNQVFELGYTVFDRTNPGTTGISSAPEVNPPKYDEYQWTQTQGSSLCDGQDDVVTKYYYSSSDPLEPIAPDYINYKWVHVKYPNASRSVFKFTNQEDYPDVYDAASLKLDTDLYNKNAPCYDAGDNRPWESTFLCGSGDPRSPQRRGQPYCNAGMPESERPYGVRSSAAHRRGILLEQVDLDSDSRLMTVTENTYDFTLRDVVLRSAVVAKEQEVFAYRIFNWYYNVKFYQIERAWVPLQQQLVTAYDQRRGNTRSIATTQLQTAYSYNNYLVNMVTKTNPTSGKTYYTFLGRVADYNPAFSNPSSWPTGIPELHAGHSLATVLTTSEYMQQNASSGWELLSTSEQEYLVRNGKALPKHLATKDYTVGGSQPEKRLSTQAVEYDDDANLVNALSNNGIWSGTLYGHSKLLPIASVANGKFSIDDYNGQVRATAGHTSFEEYGAADGWWPVQEYRDGEAKTGNRSIKLHRAVSEWGTGRRFRLAPEDVHGKYVFSCWAKLPKEQTASTEFVLVAVLKDGSGNQNNLKWHGNTAYVSSTQEWHRCQVEVNLDDPAVKNLVPSGQAAVIQCYLWLTGGNPVLIDEIRFVSSEARMVTSTYQPFVGKTSSTDENQVTTYFLYDTNNDLRLVKDAKGNIVKRITTHLASSPDISVSIAKTGGNLYPWNAATFTATVPECASGVTYYWNFGDGTTAKGGPVQDHTYNRMGSYQVTVVAEAPDANPVEGTATAQVVAPVELAPSYSGPASCDLCTPSCGITHLTVTPSQGSGSGYTFRWLVNEYQPLYGTWTGWTEDSNTTATYTYSHGSPRSVQVQCIVTDSDGNTNEYQYYFDTYFSSPDCSDPGYEVRQVTPAAPPSKK